MPWRPNPTRSRPSWTRWRPVSGRADACSTWAPGRAAGSACSTRRSVRRPSVRTLTRCRGSWRAAQTLWCDAGAGTGLLSCTEPAADLASRVDHRITPLTGPEAIAGSTRLKAGTATKLVLNTVTTGAMIRIGKVYGNLMVDLRATSAKLVDRSLRIVEALTGLGRAEAMTLLAEADGRVKTALAMYGMEVGREEADRRLESCDGALGVCLDRFPPEGRA